MQPTRAMYPVPQQLTAVLPHRRERQSSKISRIPIGILSENAFVEQLLKLLDDGMPLLYDRGFDAEDLLGKAAATGAQLLVRLQGAAAQARQTCLPDGIYLTRINGVLRIIDAHISVTTAKDCAATTGWSPP